MNETAVEPATGPDQAQELEQVAAFAQRVLADGAGGLTWLLAALGDRHGLFRALARSGPATAAELGAASGVHERYAREWAAAMAAAGYLGYAADTGRFALPAAHAPVLTAEDHPMAAGGVLQWLLGVLPALDAISEAFRTGAGVPAQRYGPDLWPAIERLGAPMYATALVPQWLPRLARAQAALRAGAAVADVGAGAGRALITLAREYPAGRYVGFDTIAAQVERARANAAAAGVADRVRFEVGDGCAGLPGGYDVVLAFDVLHDASDPAGMLRSVRQALAPDGTLVCLELAAGETLADNLTPVGQLYYAVSVLYCLSSSLGADAGGAALGSLGLPERRLAELGRQAGFDTVRKVLDVPPAHVLYELLP